MPPPRRAKPRSPEHAALGRAVESLRYEAGLTQEQLAERVNTEFPRIGGLERGTSNPTFTTMLRIASGLDVALSEIIDRFEHERARGS